MTFSSLSRSAALMLLCFLLTACGLTQAVSDGTVSATRAIFYKKIKVLHLDFEPRGAINADESQTPLATMVQIYQLKDRQKVDSADYQELLSDADNTLKEDIVSSVSLLVMPKGSVTLNMPMNEDGKFVAVVGLFNRPDMLNSTWKLVLSRDDLDPDKPRTIQLNSTGLTLVTVKE